MKGRDLAYLARAIRLAARGGLSCAPNPQVGCVLVKEDVIVGEGWHQQAGQGHAEIRALAAAGAQAAGSTAYVSLEPCNHQGRTGPCSEALVQAGVVRVVYAASDAGARSRGGAQALSAAGVAVEAGGLADDAQALNPGFHRVMQGGLPWVRLKIAQSLDGRTALPDGQSQWITGEAARTDGHRWRARSSAIVTGSATVLADNPRMNARLPADELDCDVPVNQPLRVVLDTQLRTPDDARLRDDANYLLMHGVASEAGEHHCLMPTHAGGLDLHACIAELARRGCHEILLETGPTLSGAFLKAGLVDEVIVYTADSFLGEGKPAAALGILPNLAQRLKFHVLDERRIGTDSRIIARPERPDL